MPNPIKPVKAQASTLSLEELIKEKVAAGLTLTQAESVVRRQLGLPARETDVRITTRLDAGLTLAQAESVTLREDSIPAEAPVAVVLSAKATKSKVARTSAKTVVKAVVKAKAKSLSEATASDETKPPTP